MGMRVCVFGTYAEHEPRNINLLKGLERKDVKLIYCNLPAKSRRSDSGTYTFFGLMSICWYYLTSYIKLIRIYRKAPVHDALLILFPGYLDVLVAKSISKKPIIYSAHISLYDALVVDRKFIKNTLLANLCFKIDKLACEKATVVVLDTNAHCRYFMELFDLHVSKVKKIYIGADEEVFYPRPARKHEQFTILSYGKFVPIQGLEYIIDAAEILKDYKFLMVGTGQTKTDMIIRATGLGNVEFIDWTPHEELVKIIADSDVCIGGQFGSSPRTDLIISIKAFEMIAMGKPIVVSNTKGMNELFTDGLNCVMCEPNGDSIANAIDKAKAKKNIGNHAHELFINECTINVVGDKLKEVIADAME